MILKGRKLLMERLERVLKYIVCIHIHYHVQFHLNRSYDLRHTLGSFFVIMIVRQAPASGCNFIFFFFFGGKAMLRWYGVLKPLSPLVQLNILMCAQRNGWSGLENPNSGLLHTFTPVPVKGGKDVPTNRNSLTHTLVCDPGDPVHLHTRYYARSECPWWNSVLRSFLCSCALKWLKHLSTSVDVTAGLSLHWDCSPLQREGDTNEAAWNLQNTTERFI